MTIGSIMLATALLFLVGVYVFRPMLVPVRAIVPPSPKAVLLAEKDALLTEIQRLDFDFEMGSLPEETYQRERYQLVQQAADMLRQADQMADEPDGIDEKIEAAIAALRNIPPAVKPATSRVTCPNCNQAISQADKFCRNCGEKLA